MLIIAMVTLVSFLRHLEKGDARNFSSPLVVAAVVVAAVAAFRRLVGRRIEYLALAFLTLFLFFSVFVASFVA